METLALLLIVHALCDYPLQGDFLSRAKNPSAPIDGVPWQWAMAAHCAIHAGGVWLVTMSWPLAAIEFLAHWFIDSLKCHRFISFSVDQAMHLACKVIIAAVVWGCR
ncbi:MAG: DUF3307 domain-containing protein [Rhodocyclaceae bacterium]|nr:MAG: DUF3307 domain-containing protein [Rhodocyclaceae bacterium]